LEGNRGFCQAFSDRRFLDKITRNLGAEFRILEVEHKRYCCCGTQSAGLDAVSIIMHDHDITPKQIDEIIVSAPTPILKLTSTITDPEDITGAQLSRRFGIALRLVKGGNGFNEYNEKNLKDPEILSLAARIKYLTDDDLEKIVDLLIRQGNDVLRQKKITISLRPEVRTWIVRKTCHDRSYGARPLRRALQKYIEDPLSEAMIQNRFKPESVLEIYVEGDHLCYVPVGGAQESGVRLTVH